MWSLPPGAAFTTLYEVLCCRQHDLAAQALGFLGRSGFSGDVLGAIYGRRPIRPQTAGVWDPDSSSGDGPGLVDP